MKLAIDVHFGPEGARAAALVFEAWDAPEAERTLLTRIATTVEGMKKPARGEPDLRALPCILQLLREHALPTAPELILLHGSVYLDALEETPGLGQHLFQALGGKVAIVGLASKSALPGLPAQFELYREDKEDEEEAKPLIITCAGIDLGAAKARVRGMHGKRRMPTLMKRVARLAKNGDQ